MVLKEELIKKNNSVSINYYESFDLLLKKIRDERGMLLRLI